MSSASFFAGASNVKITGGEFNIIKGDHIVYDQSRHSNFNNAFNSQNNVTLDSHNNNNKTYHNVDPHSRSTSSRRPTTPESKGRDPRDYFPTPSLHPMFHQHSPSNLLPASRSRLDDSFNVTNNLATNVMNDNNEIYGAPHPKDRKERKRKDVKKKYPDSDSSKTDTKVEHNSYFPYGGNQPLRGQVLFQANIANSRPNYASPYFHNQGPSRQNFAQVNSGDIQPMSMEIQALMGQLTTRFREETSGTGVQVPAPAQADNHRRATVEDDGENASNVTDSDDDEQPTRMEDPRDPRTVTNSMANLTVNEQLRRAFSSTKSSPQTPQPVPPQFAATPASPASVPHAPKSPSMMSNSGSIINDDIYNIDNTSYSTSIEVSPEERAGSCWLGAVNALHHIQTNYSQFEAIFSLADVPIEDDSLEIYAGFDEGLIQDGVGFMEQIHIFLSTDIPMGKTLLSKIGRIASPFSCIMFTPAGRFSSSLFREDGSALTLNQLVRETNIGMFNRTSTLEPRGLSERSTSSETGQLDTPYDQTGGNERTEDSSYNRTAAEGGTSAFRSEKDGQSGSANQPESNKDTDKSDRDDSRDENYKDSNSSDHQSKVHRLEKPEFEVSFLLSANVPDGTCGNPSGPTQHIRTEGQIIIKMGTDERSNDITCDVGFDDLRIESSGGVGETAYEQFYLIVKIDSNQKNARIRNIRPEHTLTYDPQSIVTSSRKSSKSTGFNFAISLALSPGMSGGGSTGRGSESATSSEKKEYTSKIRRYGRDGILYWGFDIDDPTERMAGKRLDEKHRPAALFLYHTGEDYGSEKKQDIEIQVISCWSILGNKDPKFSRSGKIRRKDDKGKASIRRPVFSNILLKTTLTIPTTSTSSSIYCGEVMFPYGEETGPNHHKVERDQGPAKGDSYASTSHIADPIKLLMSTLARDRKLGANNTNQAEDSGTDSTATSTVVMIVKDQSSKISQDALSEESSSTSEVANTLTSWLTKNLLRKAEAGHAQQVN